jgi:hypothetical protein
VSKIPSRWLPYVEAAATTTGPVAARATRLLDDHEAARARRLVRSLPRRKAEAADHQAATGATRAVRAAVVTRAAGRCECCGGEVSVSRGHMDHFFGRARSELVETCWFLCSSPHGEGGCDEKKTANKPTRLFWLLRFKRHCALHGYARPVPMLDAQIALEQGQHPTKETATP